MSTPSVLSSKNLTDQQKRWFASVREGLEKETGKSFADWVKIAKTCPEEKHRARTKWFKDHYGIGLNRASVILAEAFPASLGWDRPEELKDALWKDENHRKIVDKLEQAICTFDNVVVGSRKTFTAYSRKVQFAAARPYKGQVRLGLAVDPALDDTLAPPLKSEGWSDRLTAVTMLTKKGDVSPALIKFLKKAWEMA